MKIGIYPGTFDPVTNGHIDIIERGRKLFDKLYVVISTNFNKKTLFSIEERVKFIEEIFGEYDDVEVLTTDMLTAEFAKSKNAIAMLRGLRMMSDFEYELQLATFNKVLVEEVETVFIMSKHEFSYISSSNVKEIAFYGGEINQFVPNNVAIKLKEINKIKK